MIVQTNEGNNKMNLEKPLIGGIIIVGVLFLTAIYMDKNSKSKNIGATKTIGTVQSPSNPSSPTNSIETQPHGSQPDNESSPQSTDSSHAATSCDSFCRADVLDLWTKTGKLSKSNIAKIVNDPRNFAQLFAQNPTSLASLLAVLKADENEHGDIHKAATLIHAALTAEDKIQSGTVLLQSENNKHRIIGLELIGKNFTDSSELSNAFNQFTTHETDPHVLITALNQISEVDHEDAAAQNILTGLDRLIYHSSSDFISGTSLIKKVELFEPSETIRNDVRIAIENPSPKRQRYGLQALSIVIDKEYANAYDQDFTTKAFWEGQTEIVQALQDITSNPDTPEADKKVAQEILNFIPDF